jgi:hypothetical protein
MAASNETIEADILRILRQNGDEMAFEDFLEKLMARTVTMGKAGKALDRLKTAGHIEWSEGLCPKKITKLATCLQSPGMSNEQLEELGFLVYDGEDGFRATLFRNKGWQTPTLVFQRRPESIMEVFCELAQLARREGRSEACGYVMRKAGTYEKEYGTKELP